MFPIRGVDQYSQFPERSARQEQKQQQKLLLQQQLLHQQHQLQQQQQQQLILQQEQQQLKQQRRAKHKISELGTVRSTMESSFSSGSWSYTYGPPLDYSFRNISSLEKVERRRLNPRQSLRKTRRSPSGRYNSNVIRLANNNLSDTTGLYQMALDVVEFPEDIAWLDLSFNDITEVSDDILQFQALKMLYLHGNKIKGFADISKLKQLPNMYSLTLHGNPIENQPHYRSSIICMFPQLRSLDFAKITQDEKDSARLHIIVNNNNVKKHSM